MPDGPRTPSPQVTDYRFDSSAIEVVLLAVVRLVVLLAVLLRSRACLVRVNGDGRIKPSPGAMVAFVVCAGCAAYCVFKVGNMLVCEYVNVHVMYQCNGYP